MEYFKNAIGIINELSGFGLGAAVGMILFTVTERVFDFIKFKHETQFKKLHEVKFKILVKIYENIINAFNTIPNIDFEKSLAELDPPVTERAKILNAIASDLDTSLKLNDIFLDNKTCLILKNIIFGFGVLSEDLIEIKNDKELQQRLEIFDSFISPYIDELMKMYRMHLGT